MLLAEDVIRQHWRPGNSFVQHHAGTSKQLLSGWQYTVWARHYGPSVHGFDVTIPCLHYHLARPYSSCRHQCPAAEMYYLAVNCLTNGCCIYIIYGGGKTCTCNCQGMQSMHNMHESFFLKQKCFLVRKGATRGKADIECCSCYIGLSFFTSKQMTSPKTHLASLPAGLLLSYLLFPRNF